MYKIYTNYIAMSSDQTQNQDQDEVQVQENVENMQNKQDKRNEELKEKMELRRKQQIQFIMTQTNYDEMEASEKLENCKNDVMKVVTEYLGITPKKNENIKKSKNQKVYSVIREIMDSGSKNFIMQQERAKKIEEFKKHMEEVKKHMEEVKNRNQEHVYNKNETIKEKID
jgi:hypothetical protein